MLRTDIRLFVGIGRRHGVDLTMRRSLRVAIPDDVASIARRQTA
ncbi:hypothetical protein [Musicola paradisiaca]|nr:hypothetical protein [Musicola paradisiaca]